MDTKRPDSLRSTAICAAFTLFIVILFGTTVLSGCAGSLGSEGYVSPYDWSGLERTGERLDYYEDGELRSSWGIDVSEHQHAIDWERVAESGVRFAFIRIGNRGATAGALDTDETFLSNSLSAEAAGIATSAYFFSQAITEDEAREEAQYALQRIRAAEMQGASFDVIAYDHEAVEIEGARANDLSDEQFAANALAFCETISKAGYKTMIYGNQQDLLRIKDDLRNDLPVWLAEYDVEAPTAPLDFVIWQYSCTGRVPGIEGAVDLNIWLQPPDQAQDD